MLGQRQVTGLGILWSVHRWTRDKPDQALAASDLMHVKHLTIDKPDYYLDQKFKKRNELHT